MATPSFYRIQDLESQLYVRFTCILVPRDQAPRVIPRLTSRERATRFPHHYAAAQCFARYLGAAPFEIVRCDS